MAGVSNRATAGFPARLRLARKKIGLSQRQLDARIGLGRGTVCRLEQGARLDMEHAAQLAIALGVGLEELVIGKRSAQAKAKPGSTKAMFAAIMAAITDLMGILRPA